jgi:hypothetical protein
MNYEKIPMYIRFRIKCNDFGCIFKKIKPKNSFFESAFNENELIDFRLNEKRNQHETLINEIGKHKYLKIKKINFFVISPVEHDIKFNGSNLTYKRQLENNKYWKPYLDSEYNNMIVYKVKIEKDIEDFSIYLNFQYRKSNLLTILKYMLILGLTAVIFNLIGSLVFKLIFEGRVIK